MIINNGIQGRMKPLESEYEVMSEEEMNIGIDQTPHRIKKTRSGKKFLPAMLGIALLLFGALQAINFMTQKNLETENSFIIPQNINSDSNKVTSTQQMGDNFYKAASEGAALPANSGQQAQAATANPSPQTKTATKPAQNKDNKDKQPKDELVTVNLSANVGRAHPFVPAVTMSAYSKMPKTPVVSYPAPPTQIIPDDSAIKLMSTTISGIMYDALSPSAIISVEGQDHLVRKGDRINGYKIVNITKDRVIVQNGTNVYRATVGETLTTEASGINVNNVYNLQQKFGGSTAPKGTKMIQIN